MNIYYLGPAGSFSHIVGKQIINILSKNYSLKPVADFSEFFSNKFTNKNDLLLLPIENSLGGSVSEILDQILISPFDLEIKLEQVFLIEHCLVSFAKSVQEITEIRAHYQALAQCREFIKQNCNNLLEKKEFPSNSLACKSLISENKNNNIAAICSKEAAELYNIPVLKEKINDSENNHTRFWLVGLKQNNINIKNNIKNNYLISLSFQIPQDLPGGLVKILNCLAKRNINLSKIESRPTKSRLCEYNFLIDFICPDNWENINFVLLNEINNLCSQMRFLGKYLVLPHFDQRFNNI